MSDKIITVNETTLKNELKEYIKKTIQETLNELLDAEAEELVKAEKYERSQNRVAYRSGHYKRGLTTTSGQIELKIPKLRNAKFQTAIIERYQRRETSVEEAMVEMYLAGVSTRRIEDVTELLWDSSVSPATISNLNEKAYSKIEEWRSRPLTGKYPYVYVDGIYLKRNWGGSYSNVCILVAIGVNENGEREIIGCDEGFRESKESWKEFLLWLKSRGLAGVQLLVADKCQGLIGSLEEVFPEAKYQRCTVHFYRNVLNKVPQKKRQFVGKMVRAIHEQESFEASMCKAEDVIKKLSEDGLKEAAKVVKDGCLETLTYTDFPIKHWKYIRTNNGIERINREIRRRTRVVGTFPDGKSALMLVTARLKYIAEGQWQKRKYLNMSLLEEKEVSD